MPAPQVGALLLALLALAGVSESADGPGGQYLGREVGALSELHHGVRGRVFAVDSRTLYLHDFHYDGEGPAAYFYVGTSAAVSGGAGAVRLRDERGGAGPLRRYRGEGLTLALPDGKTLKDIKWFAVWCDEYSVNFGSVSIGRSLEVPRPVRLGALRGAHGVSSDPLVVVDAQTLLLPNFSYDGEAPDAKFWVGRGESPSPQGIRIPDEHGSEAPLRKYHRKTIVLTLPGELTVFDIGHLAVWCEAFTVNFGHVPLPRAQLANVPPSLKMLGVSPQNRNKELVEQSAPPAARGRRPSPRRPLANLEATTYRPQLRPGSGPLASAPDSAPHTLLHRRADTYSSPDAQLLQPNQKDAKNERSEAEQHKHVDKEVQNEEQIGRKQQTESLQIQQQESVPEQTSEKNEYYQQQRSQEIYQEHYQEPFYQPQFFNPYQVPHMYPDVYEKRFDQRAFDFIRHQQPAPQFRLVPY